ncbi:helix-hairpin-helix domain-containing protein, partial [Pandoraea pneumonica]|uniref:helix-hairpin-helix domain-containing protein n=1 Tax=Pandoraea pneumonica TaxID=2508299 RepID=UPI003CF7B1DC
MKTHFLSLTITTLLYSNLTLTKININTTTLKKLNTLYNINKTHTQTIINYQQQNTPFKSLHNLKKIPNLHKNII